MGEKVQYLGVEGVEEFGICKAHALHGFPPTLLVLATAGRADAVEEMAVASPTPTLCVESKQEGVNSGGGGGATSASGFCPFIAQAYCPVSRSPLAVVPQRANHQLTSPSLTPSLLDWLVAARPSPDEETRLTSHLPASCLPPALGPVDDAKPRRPMDEKAPLFSSGSSPSPRTGQRRPRDAMTDDGLEARERSS